MSDFSRYIPFIHEGQVVSTNDPDQMGRVKVWVPALDGEFFEVDQLPWADYATPLAGFTSDYPGGAGTKQNVSQTSYGWWAIPKMGATVYVFCLAGDPTRRVYFASSMRLHRNRSLPNGRNKDFDGQEGPWGDAVDETSGKFLPIEPAYSNLREQFQGKLTDSESITRGVYERQAAQAKFGKTGEEGYSKTPVTGEDYLDPQTYCFVTPGRHAIIFQDDPKYARLRIKTGEGHQMIFDDANERIYISTAKGATWFEMDLDGHINVFGAESISLRAGKDINLFADENINLEAGKGVNIKADTESFSVSAKQNINMISEAKFMINACKDIHINGEKGIFVSAVNSLDVSLGQDFTLSSGRQIDITSSSNMKLQGSRIDLNGPTPRQAKEAACAPQAAAPTVVPGHEPWRRPVSTITRNKNWKA